MNQLLPAFIALLSCLDSAAFLRAADPQPEIRPQLAPEVRARCLATLRKAIKSDEFWPAMHAAEALTLSGAGDEVIVELRDRLPTEQDDQRRCGLARELVRAGDRSRLPLLFEILVDPKSNGRVHAAESLYKLGEVGDGRALQAAFADGENPQLRLMAAAALARSGRADAFSWLREQLRSDDRIVRNTVAFALARLGKPSDIQPLLKALDHETDGVSRAVLVNALASLGNARGLKELQKNLNSTDPSVRSLSAEIAGHCRCVACQAQLIQLLNDSATDARVRAAQSLILLSLPAKRGS